MSEPVAGGLLAIAGKPDKGRVPGDNIWVEVMPNGKSVNIIAHISFDPNRWQGLAENYRSQGQRPRDLETAIRAAVKGIETQLEEQLGRPEGRGHNFFRGVADLQYSHPKTDDYQALADETLDRMNQGIMDGANLVKEMNATPARRGSISM